MSGNDSIREASDTERKLLSSLGLCMRAGKLLVGVPMIVEAIRKGGKNAPVLVLESSDTSEATHKKITDKTAYYQVRTVRLNCDGAALASALGKTSSLAAVAVTDIQMCRMIEKYI